MGKKDDLDDSELVAESFKKRTPIYVDEEGLVHIEDEDGDMSSPEYQSKARTKIKPHIWFL